MKKFLFALLAFATIGFVACNDDDPVDSSNNSDDLVQTAYIIEELPQQVLDTLGFNEDLDYAIALSFINNKDVKVELSVSENGTTMVAWAETVNYQYNNGVGKFQISRNDVNNPGQKVRITIDMQESGNGVEFSALYGLIKFNAQKISFTANRTVSDKLANTYWVADMQKMQQYASSEMMEMFSVTNNPIGMAFTTGKTGTMQVNLNTFGSATVQTEYTVDQLTKLDKYFGSFELKGTDVTSRALTNAIGTIGYVLNGDEDMVVYILLVDVDAFTSGNLDNAMEVYIPMKKTTVNPIEEEPTENPDDNTDYDMTGKIFNFDQTIPNTEVNINGNLTFEDGENGIFYANIPEITIAGIDLSEIGEMEIRFTYTIEGNVITMTLDPELWERLVEDKPILNTVFPNGKINGILSDGGNTITFKMFNNVLSIKSEVEE